MSKTFAQLEKEIQDLVAQAEKMKQQERPVLIQRIKADIAAFGLTTKELFGGAGGYRLPKLKGARPTARSAGAKYSDGSGNTWVGRGKRPDWLRAALAAGRNLSDFESGAARASSDPVETASNAGNGAQPTNGAAAGNGTNGTNGTKGTKGRKGAKTAKATKATKAAKGLPPAPSKGKASKAIAPVKLSARAGATYKDEAGNSWSGRGPMPKWLKAAVAGGKKLEDLAT